LRTLLETGQPATIVAFGTSLTASGEYLSDLVPALERAFPRAAVRLQRLGRRGFDTVLAAFDAQSVVAERPDLVILEFTVNDYSPAGRALLVPALLGIVGQIRESLPSCEFAFVYFARAVDKVHGDRFQIPIHDAVAGYFGWPSIDLASLAHELVERGAAEYTGDSPRALTRDGTHHTPAAAELLGRPFAAAFVDAVRTNGPGPAEGDLPPLATVVDAVVASAPATLAGVVSTEFRFDADVFGRLITDRFEFPDRDRTDPIKYVDLVFAPAHAPRSPNAPESLFRRARRVAAKNFVTPGGWAAGRATGAAASLDCAPELAVAVADGARLRFPLCGSFACFTGFAFGGAIATWIDGRQTVVRPATVDAPEGRQNWPLLITNGLSDAPHVIEIDAEGKKTAFSDIFYIAPSQ
jgi:lysophospholipase L1-like esterase